LDLAERPALPRSPTGDAVDQIAARPLFSESRRPYAAPPAPVEEAAQPTQPSLPLELAGTFLTDTDQAALLLVAGGSPAWLRRGQLIEGWRIETIERDRVQLRKDGQQQVLQLRADIPVPEKTTIWRQAAGDDATSPGLDSESVDEEATPPE
jgi:type II secretory pathway component PulC